MPDINFGVNLLPSTNLGFNLGSAQKKWNIYGDVTGNVSGTAGSVAWANVTNKPLTLTAATTGFTIAGGSTNSRTLTVNDNYTLAAACAKAVTDSSSASAISTGTSLPTERDIYYGLPTINGIHNYTSSTNYYIPTAVGTSGQVLKSQGSGAPEWANEYSVEILDITPQT